MQVQANKRPVVEDIEKIIYNLFLKTCQKHRGKPFNPRRQWDDLPEKFLRTLKLLASYFKSNPMYLSEDYFEAPYQVIQEGKIEKEIYKLSFYMTDAARWSYSLYLRNRNLEDPRKMKDKLIEDFRFIVGFCKENGIYNIDDYPYFVDKSSANKENYAFLHHLKDHRINIYLIHLFPVMATLVGGLDDDYVNLFFDKELVGKTYLIISRDPQFISYLRRVKMKANAALTSGD